ncbi:MAG: monovalent cation/H(+) antiporter subunit G [Alphaproteobacteria bacterium]|nr:monovalent cation/H(+) antiporter subunit G [Alphaproteobacteria bacterium]
MTPDTLRFAIAAALAGVGLVLAAGGALGVLRFGDVFARAHAVRALSWGAPFVLAAIAVEAWRIDVALRLALVAAALAVTGPALTHLIAHAAHRAGVEPDSRR